MVAVVGAGKVAGSDFGGSFSLPNTDSQAAVTLLTQNFPSASGEGDQVVIQATHGATITSAPVRAAVSAALAKVAEVPGVEVTAAGAGQRCGLSGSAAGQFALYSVALLATFTLCGIR